MKRINNSNINSILYNCYEITMILLNNNETSSRSRVNIWKWLHLKLYYSLCKIGIMWCQMLCLVCLTKTFVCESVTGCVSWRCRKKEKRDVKGSVRKTYIFDCLVQLLFHKPLTPWKINYSFCSNPIIIFQIPIN